MKRWIAAAVAVLMSGPAIADEVILRGVTAFASGTTFSRPFEAFVNRVNETGKGVVQIQIMGGPEAVPPFELGNAVSSGVIDVANVTSAFYTNLLPVGDALHLNTNSAIDQRANGCYDKIDALHRQQMNVKYLVRLLDHVPYHLYLTKPIDGPDLTGLTIRTTPVYRAMFDALGANLVRTAPGEVYSALERGTIDGYGWPIQGVLDLGWQEQTKYRVDPGFYQADTNALVNLDTWDGLSDEAKQVLEGAAIWAEQQSESNLAASEAEKAAQAEAGIQTITFEGDSAAKWLDTADKEGWSAVAAIDAAIAEDLKACLTR